jgi:alpha-amylase/alpha-mannosidase (GH57 family)
MTRVAILWHMHQPFYEDLVTHEHILPWVRLHALKDYFGMAALLREFPQVRATFNLVPSLLGQLEDFALDRARDRYLELGLKPAADLTESDAHFILDNFFHAQRQRMIDPYPRYAELLARRGDPTPMPGDHPGAAARFSTDDLRDLQVWQKLAWIDPGYLESDPRVRGLVGKGRDFTEQDKALLREVELELLNKVVPEYRDLAARGQIEISTSPFYHPILPLLCDTEIYHRTHPQSKMPRQRFVHPEDATEQLERAAAYHERLFGRRPAGLWPSEGSVSDEVVRLAVAAGFTWMATDELILARTLGVSTTRDAHGQLEQPERFYRAYAVRAGEAAIACLFRDHVLSDLIGFTYAGWPAETAAADFVERLAEAGRRYTDRTGGGEATIPIILDGENAWEHFEGGGRPFLRALYGRLSSHPGVQTVTMAQACEAPAAELEGIFPGSWIDGNFYIWIGHEDDRRAWGQLAEARLALERPGGVDPHALARAREEILVAEGSDWFWWYGDDHSSAHDREFDDLFRRHLRNVYRLLERPVPDELFLTNISVGAPPPLETQPSAWLRPTLDGEDTSYFEWLGAGTLDVAALTAGAMQRAERARPLLTRAAFGFDPEHLYVRLDGVRRLADLLEEGFEFSVKFLEPDGVRYSVRCDQGQPVGRFWDRQADPPRWVERGAGSARLAVGTVAELAVPFADLGVGPGRRLALVVAAYDRTSAELERHPPQQPVELVVPGREFEARNWSV